MYVLIFIMAGLQRGEPVHNVYQVARGDVLLLYYSIRQAVHQIAKQQAGPILELSEAQLQESFQCSD